MPVPYRKLTVAIALCGIFTLGIWPAFHSPAIPMDEGMVLVYPEMILKGQLPYRDFESITAPGNSMILAGAYAGFGPNLFVERAVGLASKSSSYWRFSESRSVGELLSQPAARSSRSCSWPGPISGQILGIPACRSRSVRFGQWQMSCRAGAVLSPASSPALPS